MFITPLTITPVFDISDTVWLLNTPTQGNISTVSMPPCTSWGIYKSIMWILVSSSLVVTAVELILLQLFAKYCWMPEICQKYVLRSYFTQDSRGWISTCPPTSRTLLFPCCPGRWSSTFVFVTLTKNPQFWKMFYRTAMFLSVWDTSIKNG